MNQETLVLLVRAVALVLVGVIVWLVIRMLRRARRTDDWEHPRNRPSVLDGKGDAQPAEVDPYDSESIEVRKTSRLNPGFFGKPLQEETPPLPEELKMDLPLSVMARFGQSFTGEDVEMLVKTFGLQRSPAGIYELLNEGGKDVLFSMLNVHKPGTFPEDLQEISAIDGVLLVMQLPNGHDAVKSYETFSALAKEMAETSDGRLCDFQRRPLGPKS